MKRETIFITGASAGIGAAMATAFAKSGCNVVLAARRKHLLDSVIAEMTVSSEQVLAVETDITELDSCKAAIAAGVQQFGGIDVLINNAGYLGPRTSLATYEPDAFLQSLRVNVQGTFQMIQAALPYLRAAEKGRIVSISSYLGRHGLPDCSGYIAGKFGVEGITQAVHHEENSNGLIAVTLAPGMVATEMLRNYLQEDDVSEYRTPDSVGAATVRCVASLQPEQSGTQLDIDPWMEG